MILSINGKYRKGKSVKRRALLMMMPNNKIKS